MIVDLSDLSVVDGHCHPLLVERGELTVDEARAAGRRILSENALALHGLPARA